MSMIQNLFERNREWVAQVTAHDPGFFTRLKQQQTPEYLWIGCSDSRVPATQITGMMPGEIFVHRNVANVVVYTDLNCLSVMQFAVDVLRVKHIIVCGHYGCGGVNAALHNSKLGLIDNWLRHIQDVAKKHAALLTSLDDDHARFDRLCELNVIEQVRNVCQTTVVQDAWARGQSLAVHGVIYGIGDGLLQDLRMMVAKSEDLQSTYAEAVEQLAARR
ncbi:MAG: carbonate dehydratase [Caldilinea sp.]